MELDSKEAKQLGSLARDGGIGKAIGKKAQVLSLWRRLLSGVRERYPFNDDLYAILANGPIWKGVFST